MPIVIPSQIREHRPFPVHLQPLNLLLNLGVDVVQLWEQPQYGLVTADILVDLGGYQAQGVHLVVVGLVLAVGADQAILLAFLG